MDSVPQQTTAKRPPGRTCLKPPVLGVVWTLAGSPASFLNKNARSTSSGVSETDRLPQMANRIDLSDHGTGVKSSPAVVNPQ